MKKILSLFVLLAAFFINAKAQDTIYVTPVILSPAVTFSNCKLGDSAIVKYCFINRGPDTIKVRDTIAINTLFGYSENGLSLYFPPANILPGDTFLQRSRYFRRTDINWLVDTGGHVVIPNFPNNAYSGIFSWYGVVTKVDAYTYRKKTTVITNTATTPGYSSIAKLAITINCPLPPTGINDPLLSKGALFIFPNPAANEISFTNNFEIASPAAYRITDIAGRVVKSTDLGKQNPSEKTFKIDISNLTKGMYYIELVTSTSKSVSKFIKN